MKKSPEAGVGLLILFLLASHRRHFLRSRLLRRSHESRCLRRTRYSNWLDPCALWNAFEVQTDSEFHPCSGADSAKDYRRFQKGSGEHQEGGVTRSEGQDSQS